MSLFRRLALAAAALLAPSLARANVPALGAAVDAPALVWTTGGAAKWTAQTTVTKDGTDAARATGLSAFDTEAWIQTTVTAPGVLSWQWRLDLDEELGSSLELLVGGESSPRQSLFPGADWTAASIALDGSGPVAVRWRLVRIADASAPDAAYLDTVAFAPFVPPVLQSPTGLNARGFTARWSTVADATDYVLEIANAADFSDARASSLIPAGTTSFTVADLEPETTYHYRLVAYGPEFLSATSAPLSVTTPAISRPGNDAFAAAATLSNVSGSVAATTLDATLETDEPFPHQASVWFKWTAPGAGRWRFIATPADTASATLFLYTGATLPDLVTLTESGSGEAPGTAVLEFDAEAGLTYRLALDSSFGLEGPVTLAWERLAAYVPPVNDAFAAALTLAGASGSLDATNLHATAESGEPAPAAHTVWFKWTATDSGLWTLDTGGSAIATTLSAWSGTTVAALTRLATDSATPPAASRVVLPVTKNQTYRVSIDGQDGARGALHLAWQLAVPDTAQTITPPELTDLPVDALPFILEGFASSGLPLTYTLLSGPATLDDDRVTLTGQPGTVKIRATQAGDATYLPAQLDFQFVVQGPPANDHLANAIRLTTVSPLEANLRFATYDLTDPFPANRSVWFRWVADRLGVLSLDTAGSASTTVLTVLTGSAAEPDLVASDLRSNTRASLQFPVTPGQTYWIALDSLETSPGAVRLAWSFTLPALDQTIDFASLPDLGLQDGPVFLEATASSSLPVSFTVVSGPATLADDVLTLTGKAGTITVRASQPGDHEYKPAPDVTVSFSVRPPPANDNASAATSLSGPTGSVAGSNIDATAESGDPFPASRSVWWRWTAPSTGVWTVDTAGGAFPASLSLLTGSSAANLQLVATDLASGTSGSLSIAVNAGTTYWIVVDTLDNQEGATKLSWSLAPPSIEQTITFDQPLPDLIVGDVAPELIPTASSELPVTVAVVSGPARIADGVLTLTGQPGTVTLRATQPGDAHYKPAPEVTRTFVVAPLPPLTITLGDLQQTYDGSARVVSATVEPEPRLHPLAITYNGSLTPPENAGTYTVVATADNTRVTGKLVVAKIPLTVTADNQRKLASQPNPELTLSYDGFAPGDSAASLARQPRVTTTAKTGSPAGDYPIRASGGVSPNYTFTYLPGNLHVDSFAGRHEGLVADAASGLPLGKLEFAVAASGVAVTGRLNLATEPVPFAFKSKLTLDPLTDTGFATLEIKRGANLYKLTLAAALEGDFAASLDRKDEELGFVALGSVPSGKRVFIPDRKEKLTWAGAHTLLLHPASTSSAEDPAGSGHATATIDAKGNLKLSGRLADGAPLTGSFAPDSAGAYRLFARPYAKRLLSSIAAEIPLQDHPNAARFPGRRYVPASSGAGLVWQKAALPESTKPSKRDKSYRAGIGPLVVPVTLDPWLPPAKRPTPITLVQRLGLADQPAAPGAFAFAFGPADLDFGELLASLPATGEFSSAGRFTLVAPVTPPANATKFSIKFSPATGAFSGRFTLRDQISPPPAKPVLRPVAFSGVLRQRPDLASDADPLLGAGYFLLAPLPGGATNELASGEIRLLAP